MSDASEVRRVVVTGGSSGIGLATALRFVADGATVVSLDLAAPPDDSIRWFATDVSDDASVRAGVAAAVDALGGIDVLVNNAGIGMFETVADTSPEEFRAVLETNLFGVFYGCHEAIPEMKKRGGGYIINISSLAGANPHPRMAAYNASKFGLNGFSEALMQEVRHDNIKVSYIMPGSVNTEFGGDSPSDEKDWQLRPADIARVVIDLLRHDDRSLPSRVEIRPSKPPKK